MEKKIDLHTHTKASDGIYFPKTLIDYAISKEITTIAITDHDTVSGIPGIIKYARRKGIELIPGIEFGVDYPAGSLHIIGLYIDINNNELLEMTERLKKSRINRMKKITETLLEEGINISYKEIEKEASGAAVGKPHIARIMIRKGYAKNMTEVFNNFMRKGKPGHVKRDRILLVEAVSIIKDAGGIPIIAHPISLNFKYFEEFENKLAEFIHSGVMGIEVYSSMHTMNDVSQFLRIANKNNIIISGGSDFHGDKGKEIGVYTDGHFIPSEILDGIKKIRET